MPSSSIPPQTHPHVTKGRQVGCFSRPETDDADLVISNLFSLMNFNKYEEAVKLFTSYSADLLFRTLKNSLYVFEIDSVNKFVSYCCGKWFKSTGPIWGQLI